MNILLVDDDYYIIQSIKTMINWENLQIKNVYSAADMSRAKSIISQVRIDIILCDIELQNETGLELVEWIRINEYLIEVIFLTSYAEFSFAQKAIELQSIEYLLKPINFKTLENTILMAVNSVNKKKETEMFKKIYQTWTNSECIRKEIFWEKLHYMDDIIDQKELGITYKEDDMFLYIRIEILDYITIYESLERGMYSYLVKKISEDLFVPKDFSVEAVYRSDSEDSLSWNVILMINSLDNESKSINKTLCEEYKKSISSNLNCKVGCYVGNIVYITDILNNIKLVLKMKEDDIFGENQVRFLNDYKLYDTVYIEPEFALWEKIVSIGDVEQIIFEVEQYLNRLALNENSNIKTLQLFLEDFDQMVYSILKVKGISINNLSKSDGLFSNKYSIKSIDYMKNYTRQILMKSIEYIKYVSEKQSVTENVKSYIQEHYGEDLTRSNISKQVFLNPDYLAKLFKQEEGITIGQFLIQKRIEKAKELLETTSMPIHKIAINVGYSNFSHFTKLFRKTTGKTPNEFRKVKNQL